MISRYDDVYFKDHALLVYEFSLICLLNFKKQDRVLKIAFFKSFFFKFSFKGLKTSTNWK